MGTGVPGDKILRIILKNGVILSLHQKSDGGGQNILRGGVSLYRMILISGFYCSTSSFRNSDPEVVACVLTVVVQ